MKLYLVFCEVSMESYAQDTRLLGVFDSESLAKECVEKNIQILDDLAGPKSRTAGFWIDELDLNNAIILEAYNDWDVTSGMDLVGGLCTGSYYE